jgi:hypothetical protein
VNFFNIFHLVKLLSTNLKLEQPYRLELHVSLENFFKSCSSFLEGYSFAVFPFGSLRSPSPMGTRGHPFKRMGTPTVLLPLKGRRTEGDVNVFKISWS